MLPLFFRMINHKKSLRFFTLVLCVVLCHVPEPRAEAVDTVVAAEITYDGGRFSPCLSLDFLHQAGEEFGVDLAAFSIPVQLGDDQLATFPLALMTGELPFSLSDSERSALLEYLQSGDGFLIAFPGCENPFWGESFKQEIAKFAEFVELKVLAADDRLLRYPLSIPDVPGQSGAVRGDILGIYVRGRLAGVFSEHGLNASDRVKGCCCCQGNDWKFGHPLLVNVTCYLFNDRLDRVLALKGAVTVPGFVEDTVGGGLVSGLADVDWRVRAWALRLAVRRGLPKEATESVTKLAASDPIPLVRRLAIEYLGQRFEASASDILLRCFDQDAELRPYLAVALCRLTPNRFQERLDALGAESVDAPLLAALAVNPEAIVHHALNMVDSPDSDTRRAAYFVLGRAACIDPETDAKICPVVENSGDQDLSWLLKGLSENWQLEFCVGSAFRGALSKRLANCTGESDESNRERGESLLSKIGSQVEADTPVASINTELATSGRIPLVFFSSYGCRMCHRARSILNGMKSGSPPHFVVREFQIRDPQAARLSEALCRHFDVPESDRLRTPMIFAPGGVLGPEGITRESVEDLLRSSQNGRMAEDWYTELGLDILGADESLAERFQSFSFGVVLVAGLLDSVNPCAFATLIFLVSYLRIARRSVRQTVQVCLAFVAGVFLAYFLIGLGAASVLNRIHTFRSIAEAVRWLAVLLALVVMLLSLRDGVLCLRGQMADMNLQLPKGLKSRIHGMIRRGTRVRHFVIGAFVTGLVVSLLELACTGQVYAPTIVYMMNTGRADDAISYLLVYNLAFVLPLLVILLLACWGVGSEALTRWLQRHAAAVKFATAALFLVLAVVLAFGQWRV
jgi:cytochrome c biogenesis protein CcdA